MEIRKSIDKLRRFQGCCQDARSETRAKKEEERVGLEELVKEDIKRAHSGGRALKPKQKLCGSSEVGLLKARLGSRKNSLIILR